MGLPPKQMEKEEEVDAEESSQEESLQEEQQQEQQQQEQQQQEQIEQQIEEEQQDQENSPQQPQQEDGEQRLSPGPVRVTLRILRSQVQQLVRDPISFLGQHHQMQPAVNRVLRSNQEQMRWRWGPTLQTAFRSGPQRNAFPHSVPQGLRSRIIYLEREPLSVIPPRTQRPNGHQIRLNMFELRGQPPNGQRLQQPPNGQRLQQPPNGQRQEEVSETYLLLLPNRPSNREGPLPMFEVHLRFDDF